MNEECFQIKVKFLPSLLTLMLKILTLLNLNLNFACNLARYFATMECKSFISCCNAEYILVILKVL